MIKAKVNISIDDVSPHPLSSISVLEQCYKVIDKFPTAKFTLFIPASYWRTIGTTATSSPLNINEFTEFCDCLCKLPKENFELAFHGFHHGIPGVSNNDELQHVSYEDALVIIERMIDVTTKAGLIDEFKMIIRPPAWRMSSAAFRACDKFGITAFALSPDDYAMATYGDLTGRNVIYYNCCPPFKPLQLFEKTEIVYHACTWDKNAFTEQASNELISFLKENEADIEFCFIGDLIGKI